MSMDRNHHFYLVVSVCMHCGMRQCHYFRLQWRFSLRFPRTVRRHWVPFRWQFSMGPVSGWSNHMHRWKAICVTKENKITTWQTDSNWYLTGGNARFKFEAVVLSPYLIIHAFQVNLILLFWSQHQCTQFYLPARLVTLPKKNQLVGFLISIFLQRETHLKSWHWHHL